MHNSAPPPKTSAHAKDSFRAKKSRGPRQLYVIRHGERIDFTFGKDWIKNSFDSAGEGKDWIKNSFDSAGEGTTRDVQCR